MSHKNRLLLMAVLPAALVFAGCGGTSGTGPDSGPPGSPDADVPDSPAPWVQLTVNPQSIDFGAVDPGTSAPITVTVSNVGTATSGPLSVTISGAGIFTSGCEGEVLAPKQSCTITVTARLTAPGQFSGTIEVGDSFLNTKKISVSSISSGGPSQWSLSPSPLDLGTVLKGKTATGTLVLTNTSRQDLTGFVIKISGDGFSLSPTGTCTDTLAVYQSCHIDVSFTAGSTLGPAKGTVMVSQEGMTKPVALSAMVAQPAPLSMIPISASLQTFVGTPSSPVTFTVDRGDGSGALPTVTITGTNARDFSFTTDCDKPLTSDGPHTCQVTVVYNPLMATVTNAVATLTVTDPGTGSSATAALTGTAFSPNCPSILGTPTDFGTVVVGSTSTEVTFTITNNGGDDLAIGGISSSVGQFVLATDNCSGKAIPPKSQCTIAVQFTPAAGDNGAVQGQIKADLGTGPCWASWLTVSGTAVPSAKTLWDQARIGNTGTSWWMNVVKGKFFLSIKLKNAWDEDSAGRAEVVGIAKLLASKSSSTALDLIPKLIELPGTWIYDPVVGETAAGPVVATTFDQATNYINGGAAPFYNTVVTAKTLVWGNYLERDSGKDTPHGLDLRIWEMASASDASTLYTNLLQNALYSPDNIPWITCQGIEAANPCP